MTCHSHSQQFQMRLEYYKALTLLLLPLDHYWNVSDNQTSSSRSSSVTVTVVLSTAVLVGSQGGNAHSSSKPIS